MFRESFDVDIAVGFSREKDAKGTYDVRDKLLGVRQRVCRFWVLDRLNEGVEFRLKAACDKRDLFGGERVGLRMAVSFSGLARLRKCA